MDNSQTDPPATKRVITEAFVKRGEAEKEFDRKFWRDAGPEARFRAAWLMVVEVELMRGKKPEDLRLRKDIEEVKRRGE